LPGLQKTGKRGNIHQLRIEGVYERRFGPRVEYTMELPHSLVVAIESAHVAFEGLSHPLKIVSVERHPAPHGRTAVTVETIHSGEPIRIVCHFTDQDLSDQPHVLDTFGATMRSTLLSTIRAEPG